MKNHLFTSESVSMGHPDKVADQISDAILDACLAQDPKSRVACETMVTTGQVVIAGEITTSAYVDFQSVVRETIKKIGYNDPAIGFDYRSCGILVAINKQSADIAQGVNNDDGLHEEQGAGDQGMMFGFACNETPELMPLPIQLSHRLVEELAKVRESGELKWLRPDSKSQVTVEYEGHKAVRVDTVVISTQHTEEVEHAEIEKDMIALCERIIPSDLLHNTRFLINPTGRFVVGGPNGDCGLTGRKIIVDTYGGMGRHGGGAFSGKDPSKVDRSAAYAARYVAKNVVAAGLADRCEVQLAYAIGFPQPVSIRVDAFGTSKYTEDQLTKMVKANFDLSPSGIVTSLDLLKPGYAATAAHGHFGRTGERFTWEITDKVEGLKASASKI